MADVSSKKVQFHFLQPSWLKNRQLLKKFILWIFSSEKKRLNHLNIIFCSDDYLLDINQTYLKHETYTDIITFELSSPLEDTQGEIYISIDRVKENSSLFYATRTDELHRVIFHGILHLAGYTDRTEPEKNIMRSKEDHYLRKYKQFVSRYNRST